jgi:hypothetical protein
VITARTGSGAVLLHRAARRIARAELHVPIPVPL